MNIEEDYNPYHIRRCVRTNRYWWIDSNSKGYLLVSEEAYKIILICKDTGIPHDTNGNVIPFETFYNGVLAPWRGGFKPRPPKKPAVIKPKELQGSRPPSGRIGASLEIVMAVRRCDLSTVQIAKRFNISIHIARSIKREIGGYSIKRLRQRIESNENRFKHLPLI